MRLNGQKMIAIQIPGKYFLIGFLHWNLLDNTRKTDQHFTILR